MEPARRLAGSLVVGLLIASVASCALLPRRAPREPLGVPIEERQTPAPPETTAVEVPRSNPGPSPTPARSPQRAAGSTAAPSGPAPTSAPPVEPVMDAAARKAALERIAADTTAASAAAARCASKTLLPDQESVYETTQSLLGQARAALARDEVWRAESLARKARQLALSLECR